MPARPAIPRMPDDVATAFAAFPSAAAGQLRAVRNLLFRTADAAPGVGALTETLKWGQPAYLTEKTGSGSTIRLGLLSAKDRRGAVFFNCRTTLVDSFRGLFGDTLAYQGDRAIILPDPDRPLPEGPLSTCLSMALTYHRAKRSAAA